MSLRQGHGLAVFTPQGVARGLREKSPEPNKEVKPSKAPVITVDVASVAKGVMVVGKFLVRRAAGKRARAQELKALALELAEQFQGFLGIPDLLSRGECSREEAQRCFEALEAEQHCRYLCHYQDEALYVFPAFLARVWSCDYCASQFAVDVATRDMPVCGCPNCGASMAQRIAD